MSREKSSRVSFTQTNNVIEKSHFVYIKKWFFTFFLLVFTYNKNWNIARIEKETNKNCEPLWISIHSFTNFSPKCCCCCWFYCFRLMDGWNSSWSSELYMKNDRRQSWKMFTIHKSPLSIKSTHHMYLFILPILCFLMLMIFSLFGCLPSLQWNCDKTHFYDLFLCLLNGKWRIACCLIFNLIFLNLYCNWNPLGSSLCSVWNDNVGVNDT